MTRELGTCPVCNGTGRMPVPEDRRADAVRYSWWGYSKEDDCCDCNNCGAQYQFGQPKGQVPLRPDGTPCTHSYTSSPARWKCCTNYRCVHCGDEYMIDSGD